jgi:hypothetical protein
MVADWWAWSPAAEAAPRHHHRHHTPRRRWQATVVVLASYDLISVSSVEFGAMIFERRQARATGSVLPVATRLYPRGSGFVPAHVVVALPWSRCASTTPTNRLMAQAIVCACCPVDVDYAVNSCSNHSSLRVTWPSEVLECVLHTVLRRDDALPHAGMYDLLWMKVVRDKEDEKW